MPILTAIKIERGFFSVFRHHAFRYERKKLVYPRKRSKSKVDINLYGHESVRVVFVLRRFSLEHFMTDDSRRNESNGNADDATRTANGNNDRKPKNCIKKIFKKPIRNSNKFKNARTRRDSVQ